MQSIALAVLTAEHFRDKYPVWETFYKSAFHSINSKTKYHLMEEPLMG